MKNYRFYQNFTYGAQCNSFDEYCWQLRVYEPIPISDILNVYEAAKK